MEICSYICTKICTQTSKTVGCCGKFKSSCWSMYGTK